MEVVKIDREIRQALAGYTVGIAGLGGLGSNIAVSLARLGIAGLVLVDYDLVEESNLNRQYYFRDQLGQKKTQALAENIGRIDEGVRLRTLDMKLDKTNSYESFQDVDILVEALDGPEDKSMLVSEVLARSQIKIVAASGIAGFSSSNKIETRRVLDRLYICGDFEENGDLYLSPKVNIVAQHQANMVLRLILGLEEV